MSSRASQSCCRSQIFIVLLQLPQRMSPCLVTRTFTKVKRQYGQVMVGTDTAMVASLSLEGSACVEGTPSGGAVHRGSEIPALGEAVSRVR